MNMFQKPGKPVLLLIFMVMFTVTGSNVSAHFDGTNHIHPNAIYVTLCPGECFEEDKDVDLEGAPPVGDIIFAFDTTGSMSSILSTAKAEAINIMNDIRTLVPDTYFAVMSHRDYPPPCCPSICTYSSSYGSSGDWAYRLDQYLTDDLAAVSSAISSLTTGGGADGPESYTRVLYESYSDPGVRWRFKSKKILVNFLDNIPHDCDVYSCYGGTSMSTGLDPGRDATVGTSDDLPILEVTDTMLKEKITMLTVVQSYSPSSPYFLLWQCLALRTGGQAYSISDPAELPTVIKDLINEELSTITILEMAAEPGYEAWLDSVDPPFYFNVLLDVPKRKSFHIRICMPIDAEPGIYTFYVYAVGDGAVYAEQQIIVQHCNLINPTPTPTTSPTPTGTWSPPSPTPTPAPVLNCASAVDVPCGGGLFSGDTSTGVNTINYYSPCSSWNESGKENIYKVTTTSFGDIVARFKSITPGINLDLFVLDSCSEFNCIAAGNNSVEARNLPPGTYYVIVDGYLGDEGSYQLEITSACAGSSVPINNKLLMFILLLLLAFPALSRVLKT